MATTKPTKPTDLMPTHFADSGVKNNFSSTKIEQGFSSNFDDILQGDNLNYMLDSIGKQLEYLNTVIDHINSIGIKKVLYINADNKLDSTDINGLLPPQAGNAGKYLTTNGTNASWSNDFRVIGEPIITLNFNYVLPPNCVWLDGTGGENNNGVVPITGDWAALFAIYGWQYDTSYTNTQQFRLPNFSNRVIWGGSSAGYIAAGLPNITGTARYGSWSALQDKSGAFNNSNNGNGGGYGDSWRGSTQIGLNFNASLSNAIYGKSSTVQPPAIKAKVYTRYK